MVEDKGTWDKVKGKTNKAVGDLRDDDSQKMKGHAQETKGEVKDATSRDRDRI